MAFQGIPSTGQVGEAADSAAETARRFLDELTGVDVSANLLLSAVAILVIVVLRRVVLRFAESRLDDVRLRYRWAKTSAYVAFVLSVLVVAQIWFEGIRSLGTFLGLLTAGLAIALKDIVSNLAAWVFIMWRRPFDLGDRIQVGEHAGDVVDMRIFQFTILEIGNWVDADQSTGRIIHVPNQKVFSESLANYTAQFEYLWNEVAVLVTFESDWRKAKAILADIVEEKAGNTQEEAEKAMRKASRRVLIYYQKLSPIVYTTVKDSGVLLTARYLCKPRARRGTSEGIWEAVLDAFAAAPDIDLAYPTQRFYLNPLEGKREARASLPWLPDEEEAEIPRGEGRSGGEPDRPGGGADEGSA